MAGLHQRLVTDLVFQKGNPAPAIAPTVNPGPGPSLNTIAAYGPIPAGATVIIEHGIQDENAGPVVPTIVFPDCASTLQVVAADALTVTIFNPDLVNDQEVIFRCERKHTIEADPTTLETLLWSGNCGAAAVATGKSAVLCFATDDVGTDFGPGTRYLEPWNGEGTADSIEVDPIIAPRDGTLQSLFARHDAAAGNGSPVVYTVRVNQVDTTLLVSLATGAVGQVSNLVDTVAVLQGDRITLSASKPKKIMNGTVLPHISMEFV